MALRPPAKTSDHITLISWLDTAVDQGAPGFSDIIREYTTADVPDPAILPRREGGEEPTEFVMRPLSEREMGIVEDLARTVSVNDDGAVDVESNSHELHWQIVRFALVEVRNMEGWTDERERFYSWDVLKMSVLENAIDRYTIDLLGSVVRRWSTLEKKGNSSSGLSQDKKNGTKRTRVERVRSIAGSARKTKDMPECTDAKKTGIGRVK